MSKRILVIDDEEAVRKSFALALMDTGYQVETVESGETGIEKVQKNEYDLIFLDLNMPGLNGVETLRELRARDNAVPIYIVTAFQAAFFDQLKRAALNGLSFEVIGKPISGDRIVVIAKGILEGSVVYRRS